MYVIRDENGRVVYLNKEKTAFVICDDEQAAEAAIKALEKLFGVSCTSDKVNIAKTSGLWTLRRPDGTKLGENVGAKIVLPSRKAAKDYSESIRMKTKRIMTPTPA